jgi:hypothetical protein
MPASDRPRSRSKYLLTAALVAAVVFFAAVPPGPARTPLSGQPDPRVLAGAYHIHTTRSDGALDRDGVARAASLAGLKFAIFTDHGDGTREPAAPEYLHGVLCVDGVEVSTDDGHYVALGIGHAPYPLGGAGDAVAEDVARMGGFGVAAHPFSPRRELAWADWAVPVDGIEWMNADSEWRDEKRFTVGRALLGYLVRPAAALASLLDRPVSTLAKWDELAATRRVIALAAHDAHGGLGRERRNLRPAFPCAFVRSDVPKLLVASEAADSSERRCPTGRRPLAGGDSGWRCLHVGGCRRDGGLTGLPCFGGDRDVPDGGDDSVGRGQSEILRACRRSGGRIDPVAPEWGSGRLAQGRDDRARNQSTRKLQGRGHGSSGAGYAADTMGVEQSCLLVCSRFRPACTGTRSGLFIAAS